VQAEMLKCSGYLLISENHRDVSGRDEEYLTTDVALFDGKISRRENGVNHLQDDLLDESLLQTAVVRTQHVDDLGRKDEPVTSVESNFSTNGPGQFIQEIGS